MQRKGLYPVRGVMLALTLAALACGSGPAVVPSATPPEPTAKPVATKKATATRAPQATHAAASTAEPPFTLSATAYDHASGLFSVTLPDGWEVKDRSSSVFADAPGSIASIEISFLSTGVELDAEALTKLIDANEANWFATFDNYAEVSREPQSDGSLGILKTLDFDGHPQVVASYYWQDGVVVFEQDFWANSDLYDAYLPGFLEVANSMTTDASALSDTPPYALSYTFTDPDRNLFQFDVPYTWAHISDSSDTTRLDTFTSPDGLAFVDSVAYDDGQTVSKSDAGKFALSLLKEFYKLDDIKVTSDQVQGDGSERLDWASAGSGLRGESFFETRGTTFLLLTWAAIESDYDTLIPVWSNLLDTYQVPQT
jgi:hypothetical protein